MHFDYNINDYNDIYSLTFALLKIEKFINVRSRSLLTVSYEVVYSKHEIFINNNETGRQVGQTCRCHLSKKQHPKIFII